MSLLMISLAPYTMLGEEQFEIGTLKKLRGSDFIGQEPVPLMSVLGDEKLYIILYSHRSKFMYTSKFFIGTMNMCMSTNKTFQAIYALEIRNGEVMLNTEVTFPHCSKCCRFNHWINGWFSMPTCQHCGREIEGYVSKRFKNTTVFLNEKRELEWWVRTRAYRTLHKNMMEELKEKIEWTELVLA